MHHDDHATLRSELQRLEDRWGLAVQSGSFGVWDLDVRRQTVHYPPAWKAMLGYEPTDEADSTATWRARVHPDDLQPMVAALQAHLAGHAPGYETEFRLRTADGRYRHVLSRGRVTERDAQGQALRAVGTLTDLTDRHEADRLRLERDRAQAASEAKSAFLSRMSHELRTPLNAVLGFAQLLAPRLGDPATATHQRQYVAHIEQAGWQLLRLVDDVLELSLIESGGLRLALEPVDMDTTLQAVMCALQPLAQQHGVQLQGPDAPLQRAVQAEPGRLREVLHLLVGNAIRYSRAGGTVRIRSQIGPDGCTVAVLDHGAGIPEAQMAHLIEPGHRLGRADRPGGSGEGVGIGLLLARSRLRLMGGDLSAHSTAGLGSRFELTLDVAREGVLAHRQGVAQPL